MSASIRRLDLTPVRRIGFGFEGAPPRNFLASRRHWAYAERRQAIENAEASKSAFTHVNSKNWSWRQKSLAEIFLGPRRINPRLCLRAWNYAQRHHVFENCRASGDMFGDANSKNRLSANSKNRIDADSKSRL
jgi:hypothetical protein